MPLHKSSTLTLCCVIYTIHLNTLNQKLLIKGFLLPVKPNSGRCAAKYCPHLQENICGPSGFYPLVNEGLNMLFSGDLQNSNAFFFMNNWWLLVKSMTISKDLKMCAMWDYSASCFTMWTEINGPALRPDAFFISSADTRGVCVSISLRLTHHRKAVRWYGQVSTRHGGVIKHSARFLAEWRFTSPSILALLSCDLQAQPCDRKT